MLARMRWSLLGLVALACSLFPAPDSLTQGQVTVDPKLPAYKPGKAGVSGTLKSVGSDTMNNEMAYWAEGFRKYFPAVQVEVEGKGSSTAPPALIAGTASLGPMSRPMKGKEIDAFKKKFGYGPTGLRTSIDMLGVYVHKDNPIAGLTLAQVDAAFSRSRRAGHGAVKTWGDLGLTGEWADRQVNLYGRNPASGTYAFFKEVVLFNGDFLDTVKEQPGSSSVVQSVAKDRYGIGYSGVGYKTADVRLVPLARKPRAAFVPAEPAKAYTGEYPLARYLLVYINARPGGTLDPLRGEFVRYVFSKEGQQDVVRSGYLPVGAAIAGQDLKKVGLAP